MFHALEEKLLKDSDFTITVDECFFYCSQVIPETPLSRSAVEKLRMCTPRVLSVREPEGEVFGPSIVAELCALASSYSPSEILAVRAAHGDVLCVLQQRSNSSVGAEDVSAEPFEECGSCGIEYPLEDFRANCCGSCDTLICKDCVASVLTSSSEVQQQMLCLACFQPVSPQHLLNDNRRLARELDLQELSHEALEVWKKLQDLHKVFQCPVHEQIRCVVAESVEEGGRVGYCRHCKQSYCADCNMIAHLRMTCDAAREARAEDKTLPYKQKIEEILVPRCPRCKCCFSGFDGCFAVYCDCGGRFCGFCFEDCGADAHPHVRMPCPFKVKHFPNIVGGSVYHFPEEYHRRSCGILMTAEVQKLLDTIDSPSVRARVISERLPEILKGNIYFIDPANFH